MSETGLLPSIDNGLSSGWNWLKGTAQGIGLGGASDADRDKMNRLNGVGQQAFGFGNQSAGGFNQLGAQGQQSLNALQALANGKNSVSAEQLRQGMQQSLNAQQSMAAGAAPNNAAMAARNAALNMGRQQYGLSGQQAVAGLAERNQAQQAYGNLLGTMRGQDLQGALGGYNAATGAYSGGLNGSRDPTIVQQLSPIVSGAMKAL